jgi:hypothetical protein
MVAQVADDCSVSWKLGVSTSLETWGFHFGRIWGFQLAQNLGFPTDLVVMGA